VPPTAHSGHVAPRRRVALGCTAAALLLHAALGWMLLRAGAPQAPRNSPAQSVVAVRWLRATAPAAPQVAVPAAREHAVPHVDAARSRAPRARRRAPVVAAPTAVTPAAAPVPIDGSVFALPRIGYGDAAPTGGLRAFAPPPASPLPLRSGAHDALRHQIVEHIQRQLAALPAPPADGRCTLSGASEPQWSCDSDLLNAAFGDHATPLARLLAAHQRSMPGAEPAVVESRFGRFRLLLP